MRWAVTFSAKAARQARKLPPRIAERLNALRVAIEFAGPVQPSMPHFGKLKNRSNEVYHCHLNKGRPTYVAVWTVEKNGVRVVEVIYAGTHEDAPY